MNEKYESNELDYETDSLQTNIINVQDDNNISFQSSKSSESSSMSSSFSSFKKGKTDPNEIERQKQNIRNIFCHDYYYLIEMIWFKIIFNFHRFIILIFKCEECQNKINIIMEKTVRGKEIDISVDPKVYDKWYISKETYIPNSQISYNFCEQCFNEASGDWTLLTNNCGDFANFIWYKIKTKDKNNI